MEMPHFAALKVTRRGDRFFAQNELARTTPFTLRGSVHESRGGPNRLRFPRRDDHSNGTGSPGQDFPQVLAMPLLRSQVCTLGRYAILPGMQCTSPQLKRDVSIITSPVSDPCDFAPFSNTASAPIAAPTNTQKNNQTDKGSPRTFITASVVLDYRATRA